MNFFFFSSRRRHTRCYRDWSSDVCSSDLGGGALSRVVDDDATAPAVDGGVDALEAAGRQIDLTTAKTEAYDSDLAVGIGLGAEKIDGGPDVALNLFIRSTAGGALAGGSVVRTTRTEAVVEVGADRRVAVLC